MTLHDVALDDRFDLSKERVLLSGAQAVIRMLLMQRERDRQAGLNTAGFVSGYRGSPLGGLDLQLWKARDKLKQSDIVFEPGLNEELAATAVWGSQQAELLGEGRHDGVFGLWYGKGPGVDRSGDVFRHANLAGTSRNGGALALMGDDHTAESSSNAHATEFQFVDTMIPILNPSGVQELIDFGLYGYALSRFAGTWAAVKCVKDNIESTASVDGSLNRLSIIRPDFDMPPGGLSIRHELNQLGQEERLHEWKRAAASAFIGANGINRIIYRGGPNPKIGVITVGKSYLDVREALDELGIDEGEAARLGLRLFKVGCPWPLDLDHIRDFAQGLDTIVVVEEKRSLIEVQLREQLYGTASQPRIIGKKDERGEWLFPAKGVLDPNEIAIVLGERILRVSGPSEALSAHVSRLRQFQAMLSDTVDVGARAPFFCSGCPHNLSTKVPEGSIAGGGIGCHFMALWMDRSTIGFTAMGGEGAQWIGQAPFTTRNHIFQNLGDGTYNHSGSLALRFAQAAGVNITYKILFNDAVAMTGGQPIEGGLTLPVLVTQVRAEGIGRIAIVSDDPGRYEGQVEFPTGTTVHHRRDMDAVQRELRVVPGVSVLVYDQTCAAEKRRRRKRGLYPEPDRRVIINELVCEGCGDCGVQSSCVSIQPVETEWGRKRRIDQSSCNKDFSCVEGFCPSFVSVHGGKPKRAAGLADRGDPLDGVASPQTVLPAGGWSAIIDGVGGTGVVTVGAILSMAAHLEGKSSGAIDMAGLAQKGGAVFTHLRIGHAPENIYAIRVSAGKADLILGCDLVVSGARKVLGAVRENRTLFVANTAEVMPGDFTRDPNFRLPVERLKKAIRKAAGASHSHFLDATATTAVLFGSSVSANMFLLGFAFQQGGVPLDADAIEQAIALNGEAVAMNVAAFRWGRRAAHDPAFVRALVAGARPDAAPKPVQTLDEIINRRAAFLRAYQDGRYAQRFLDRIARIRAVEESALRGSTAVAEAVARGLFKLMAVKDEYEVARLYTDGTFQVQLSGEFESFEKLEFHLAPPLFARRGANGRPRKATFGSWMMPAFRLLARLKVLRNSSFDPFSYLAERRAEQGDLVLFEADLDRIEAHLAVASNGQSVAAAAALASWPMSLRGFGHVKAANRVKAEAARGQVLSDFHATASVIRPAKTETLAAAE